MKRTAEELKSMIAEYIGDRTDDQSIALMEDLTDTLEDAATADVRLQELDATWRKRYMDRFRGLTENSDVIEEKEEKEDDDREKITIKDVLKEED